MIKTVIMGTGRMGSLIRTTAEGVVDAAGQPVFDIVAQIGFDLSDLESAPAADVIIDFSNVATFDAVVAYVERTGAALVSGTTGYTPEQMDRLCAAALPELPYLGAALRRLLCELPAPGSGLSLIEERTLRLLEGAPRSVAHLFGLVLDVEPTETHLGQTRRQGFESLPVFATGAAPLGAQTQRDEALIHRHASPSGRDGMPAPSAPQQAGRRIGKASAAGS